jgi:NADH dehydrogenase
MGCARGLAKHDDVQVTLLDKNNYHQFQPLLYQVATSALSPQDIAFPLRALFRKFGNVDVKMDEVTELDPQRKSVKTQHGAEYRGDYLVLAAGSQPNFFNTPGAEHAFPLYSLEDAEKLRSRIIAALEDAERDRTLIDDGALNFVVVGGGATGTEVAGAISDMIHGPVANSYSSLEFSRARVHIFDMGHALLAPFSDKAHSYAANVLQNQGVHLHLGTGIQEIGPGHVKTSTGEIMKTRCVIWGGGIKAADLAARTGLPQGKGGRINVQPDLTVEEHPEIYALGDVANVPSPDGTLLPQLGSVALQNGQWAAKAILSAAKGKPGGSFHYKDKGMMAMISRGHAVAVGGWHHHELHGPFAFAAWLGVHSYLMTGVHSRTSAFVEWANAYFSNDRSLQVLDRSDSARINWADDDDTTFTAEDMSGSRSSAKDAAERAGAP